MAITYNNLYLDVRQQFLRAGLPDPTLESRELVCCASGKSREELSRDGRLYVPDTVEQQVRRLAQRHLDGEPVAYLIGEWEFYGLPLDISESVLIPRPDTEVLVERTLLYLKTLDAPRVLDLCAGSGCIGLVVAKHIPADKNGVRIAELDEMKFRRELWSHQPLTDFWRVGRGIAKKLEQNGMFTMGDVALCSERNEDLLYKLFGKNAELLIDHAWGWEPTTIEAIKAYRPSSNSLSSGQVLHCPYEPQKAKLVVREMTDLLVLDLVDKGLVTDQMVLTVGYDIENLTDPARRAKYHGAVETDHYGRQIPKQAHGSINLDGHTSSTRKIMCAVSELFDRIVDKNLLVRRMYVVANHVLPEADAPKKNDGAVQLDLFTDYAAEEEKQKAEDAALERERKIQKAALAIKKKYGKNAILKAMNLEEGATAKDRNAQIGGHKA